MLILEFTDSGTTTESDRPGRQPNAKENRHSLERKNARGDPRFPNGTNRVLGPEKSLNRAHGWLSGVTADGFCGLWRALDQ
jgi:hypothetical protein